MYYRSREESQGAPRRLDQEGPYPPLNLPLTLTPEFIKEIEIALQQGNTWPRQQNLPPSTQNTETLKPPQTPTKIEKQKAINFQLSKITIGQWTHTQVYPDDVKGKFYFAKKKLMWEILDEVHTGTQVARLKRKIEIRWSDVLSFRATFHPHDGTETLEFELGKRPTFSMETNPQAGKHTQWKEMKEDFTLDQSASKFRRHTLHFFPGDLQKNLEKLLSGDSFWSKLAKVSFPTLPHSPLFDIGYENSNNDDSSNLPPPYGHYQTLLSFNNDLLLQYYRHEELRGSQAYAQETQTDDMDDFTLDKFGAYLHVCLAQEEEIHLDANFQTNSIGHLGQCFSNNNGSLPPDL